MRTATDAPRGTRPKKERVPHRSENLPSEEPLIYNDQLSLKVSALWVMARQLAGELRILAESASSATQHQNAMFRCVQTGESWQDAMDTGRPNDSTEQPS
jgi:hypothetical protein